MKRAFAVLIIFLSFAIALPAFSQPPTIGTLITEMKGVCEPEKASLRSLEIISTDGKGGKLIYKALQANKVVKGQKNMLFVITEPAENKGFAYLIAEKTADPMALHIYIPSTRRTLEISGLNIYDNFLATNFTYADLGFVTPACDAYKLLGEEKYNNENSYKVEEMLPKEKAKYSRIVTWITANTKLPLEKHYYDMAGILWKKEVFKSAAIVDGTPTVMSTIMNDVQRGGMSEIKISSVKNDAKLSDELFAPDNLSKALDAPEWKGFAKGE